MVIKEQVYISPYGLDRTLHIYLPDDYYDSGMSYPVMYMYDGHNLFSDMDATYGKSWGLADYMTRADRKMIIAGLECNHEGNQRLVEFCPYDFTDFDGLRYSGTGRVLMDWMVQELKPYMDSHYRTIPDRGHTGIGGSSMGGLMSFFSIVCYNEYFSRAACLSSTFSLCHAALKKDLLAVSALDPDTRVYLSWGGQELRNKRALIKYSCENLEFSHLLTERGAAVYPYLQGRGRHCEEDWEKQNGIYMSFLWDEGKA